MNITIAITITITIITTITIINLTIISTNIVGFARGMSGFLNR